MIPTCTLAKFSNETPASGLNFATKIFNRPGGRPPIIHRVLLKDTNGVGK